MTENMPGIETLGRRLVGEWKTEATHPELPGTVVPGTASVEWLEGQHFLILRSRNDHPDFPDSISILGDTDGLQWHYFDSRCIYRLIELTVREDGWEIARHVPETSDDFSQILTVVFADNDKTMIGTSKLSYDTKTWNDDLAITYRRTTRPS